MSGQLREEIAQTIQGARMVIGPVSAGHLADYLLAGPLRPLVAAAEERDALRATVARVEALIPRIRELAEFEQEAERDAVPLLLVCDHLRQALDGDAR